MSPRRGSPAAGYTEALAVALELSRGQAGVRAGRFTDPQEGQVRGYRREDLEAAAGDVQ